MTSPRYVAVLQVHGLPDPDDLTSGEGVAWTTAEIPSLPSGVLGTGYTQRARLREISGEAYQADLREPTRPGGGWSVTLDDPGGRLGAIFLADPTARRYFLETSSVNASATSWILSGDEAPVVGDVLWLDAEAVTVDAVTPILDLLWTVTVTRGACGSTATAHALVPSRDWGGSDGREARLVVSTQPDLTASRWLATLTLLREVPGGTPALARRHYGHLSAPPRPLHPRRWQVDVSPVLSLLDGHAPYAAAREVTLSRAVEAVRVVTVAVSGGASRRVATEAALWLSGVEASLLLDAHLTGLGSTVADSDAVDLYAARVAGAGGVAPHLLLRAGGDALYRVDSISLASPGLPGSTDWEGGLPLVRLGLTLAEDAGQDLARDGATVSTLANGLGTITRYPSGWIEDYGGAPLYVTQDRPAATLRALWTVTPPDALALALTGATLDGTAALWGAQSLDLPASLLAVGTPAGDPGTVTKASRVLSELAQVMPAVPLPFTAETQPADVLADLLRLYCAALIPLTDGTLTIGIWGRPSAASVALTLRADVPVEVSATLTPVTAWEVEYGRAPVTWEPSGTPRTVTVRGVRRGSGETQRIRVYDADGAGDLALRDGLLGEALRLFDLLFGGPRMVLRARVASDAEHVPTDQILLTAPEVPHYSGEGVSSRVYLVLGADLDWATGEQELLLLEDGPNNEDLASAGVLAPALRVRSVALTDPADPLVATVYVTSEGETARVDLRTAHGGIWRAIADVGGLVRVASFPQHAPALSATKDRPGVREAYATLAGLGPDWVRITLTADYLRGDLTLLDYLPEGESWVLLPDRRTDSPAGPIAPIPSQGYDAGAGVDFATVAGPRARRHSLIE